MCFSKSGTGKTPIPKYAEKDIVAFKVIRKNGNARYRSDFIVNGKNDKWIPGHIYYETTPFASLAMGWDDDSITINGDALHSCKSEAECSNHMRPNCRTVKMIIPEGSIYFDNTTEYVSSALYFPEGSAPKRGRPRKS